MLRLGHIDYSNCFPVHAQLLEEGPPAGVELVPGVPSALNAALEAGEIDVAPCSSIEYARHPDRYRILPELSISSRARVGSILLETTRAPEELDGQTVALPTASATSVVLLRLLLERHWGLSPRYEWFDQHGRDPIEEGAAAALRIGDVALRRLPSPGTRLLDLGEAWTDWTRLPFVFAVWQVSAGPEKDPELRDLAARLLRSRAYFDRNAEALAERWAGRFGLGAERLLGYWRSLDYGLDASLQEGLLRFYELAAELDECTPIRTLRFLAPTAVVPDR